MLCPVCKVPLTMSERQGIEIDYCAQCRGVWLDRGELDKIIERSQGMAPGASAPAAAAPQPSGYRPQPEYRPDPRRHDRDWDDDDDYRKKRRKNWLEELFD